MTGTDTSLVGRREELSRLRELVAPPYEQSRVLVVLGDPGVGKTVLLAEAAREARSAGVRVLAAAGRESEQDLAFAGLHQLLCPVLDRVASLPARQAGALWCQCGLGRTVGGGWEAGAMDGDRASIADIGTALGGDCGQVTRRMLERAGSPFPGRRQIAGWAQCPPGWFPARRARRASRASRQPEKVTITCPCCGFAIGAGPATARDAPQWDGLHCGRRACRYQPSPAPPGRVTEITGNAVGSLRGWRHVVPGDEQIVSAARARDLAGAALAMQPGRAARAVRQALAAPAGPGGHRVTAGAWRTGVIVAPGGCAGIGNPVACAALRRMVTGGAEAGIIVRSVTSETARTLPDGTGIPVPEVRGWHLSNGVFHPLDEPAMSAASGTGACAGESLAPQRGVRYARACPVGV